MNNNTIKHFAIRSTDTPLCPACYHLTLDLINVFNSPIRNSSLSDYRYPAMNFSCRNCKREFKIEWEKISDEEYRPLPMINDDHLIELLEEYKDI